ncbi:hypothetical protein NW762_013893 [Fusarium torreyae]|uniref:BTB domain-containing protein n=1 Tax=Fusarium torreyae TaxID=1237075 RepID=A0A9W8V7A5_9HYPO|nr:hypothetical protein NW762_013893 [Fusarium torreyae]
MKKSLLELDPQGDALLILRCPNQQRVPSAEKQEAPEDDEIASAGTDTSAQMQKNNPIRCPTTCDDLQSLLPYQSDGDPNEIQFRVSTRHLRMVSPVFRAMIEGKYKESQPNSQGLSEIRASDWNAQAFMMLLDIIHGHHRDVPRRPDLEIIAHVGLLVDYYDCLEIVEIFWDLWIYFIKDWHIFSWPTFVGYSASNAKHFSNDEMLLLFIAWAFRSRTAFTGLTSWMIINTTGLTETEWPIPSQVFVKIDEKRVELIDQLFSRLYGLQEDLVVGRFGCSLECSCRLLGCLMQQMRAKDLPMTKPDKPFDGWNVPAVVEVIRSIKTPAWRVSKAVDFCKLETQLYSSSDELDAQVPGLRLEDFQ